MFLSFPCSFNMHGHFLLLFSVCSYINPLVCCAADNFTVQGTCVCIRCDQHFYEFIMLICGFCLTLRINHISYSYVAEYFIQFSEHASEEIDQAKCVKVFFGFQLYFGFCVQQKLALFCVSDGYGGRERRSPDYYEESEPEDSRIFVAMFDYDPLSMSPNPDAAVEELPFKEGQIIKV